MQRQVHESFEISSSEESVYVREAESTSSLSLPLRSSGIKDSRVTVIVGSGHMELSASRDNLSRSSISVGSNTSDGPLRNEGSKCTRCKKSIRRHSAEIEAKKGGIRTRAWNKIGGEQLHHRHRS